MGRMNEPQPALPPGPYRVERPAEQGGAFTLWGRQGTPPDFKDGWAIPLVASGVDTVMYALRDILNAATPAPREDGWDELRREIEALPGKAILFGDGGFAVRTEYDKGWVSRPAVLAIIDRLAAARGEPGLREALDAFFEDIDADWTNDNIRPGDFAFRFRHAADRLRAAPVTPTTPEPDPQPDSPETWDEADNMCPNCITPWKCNGPHLSEQTVAGRRNADTPYYGERPGRAAHPAKVSAAMTPGLSLPLATPTTPEPDPRRFRDYPTGHPGDVDRADCDCDCHIPGEDMDPADCDHCTGMSEQERAATPEPDPELELCPDCTGTGYVRHSGDFHFRATPEPDQ